MRLHLGETMGFIRALRKVVDGAGSSGAMSVIELFHCIQEQEEPLGVGGSVEVWPTEVEQVVHLQTTSFSVNGSRLG